MFKKLFNDPLVSFMTVGIAVFGLYFSSQPDPSQVVELTPDNRDMFVRQFETLTGRSASTEDIHKIEQDFLEEEVLFREAIDQGLHLIDPAVRTQLIEQMRYQITGALPEPTEPDLVQYYLEHIKHYQKEPAISFRHVYFAQKPEDADGLLTALNQGEQVQGDEFWQGRDMPGYGESMIRGLFGEPFLAYLNQARSPVWSGPVQSRMGWHYYQVYDKSPSSQLSFDSARMQVANDFLKDQIKASVDSYIASLGDKYEVIQREQGEP